MSIVIFLRFNGNINLRNYKVSDTSLFLSAPAGLCRSIGVSNFMIHHLDQLKEDCAIVPHLNQVSFHNVHCMKISEPGHDLCLKHT